MQAKQSMLQILLHANQVKSEINNSPLLWCYEHDAFYTIKYELKL